MMIYFLLFLVRSLWEILLVVGENPFFHKLTVWRNDQSKKYVVFLLVWFTIFEVIPTIFFICSFIFYINRVSSNIKREVGTPIKTENKFDNKLSLLFKYTNLSNMTFSSSDPDDSKDIKPENPNEIQNPVDDHLQQNNDIENIISSPSQKVSFHDNHELYESDSTQDENHPLIDQHENNFLPQNRSLLGNLKSQENLSFNQLKTKLNSETENENENDWY
ncbi:hypothetical protein M0811_00046 [Anaeramoeba ignava]|uniref:Uncharacterized protein n=1 Tax=Anaeramoeba ignava TaxID=1746090 RepID=A0A9Q0LQJ1_ANAIG|nr:hypothetical protein M0811_00046 [Anaeramoeba ignava]